MSLIPIESQISATSSRASATSSRASATSVRSASTRLSNVFPTIQEPPPKFMENYTSAPHLFSKLDNKYAHRSCGEFLGRHGLRKQAGGALLHKSDDIITWGGNNANERLISRTHSTYAVPERVAASAPAHRRFPRKSAAPRNQYSLTTTTTCWQPNPKIQTEYKVLAETQHRLQKPNCWQYSTHPDYSLKRLIRNPV